MFQLIPGRFSLNRAQKTVVLFATDNAKLLSEGAQIDKSVKGLISKTLKNSRFNGGAGEIDVIHNVASKIDAVVIVGLGKVGKTTRSTWWKTGIKIAQKLDAMGVKEAAIALGETGGKTTPEDAAEAILEGFYTGFYRFDTYLTEVKPHQRSVFKKCIMLTTGHGVRLLKERMPLIKALGESANLTRKLVNLPPNVANPQYMVDQTKELAKLGIKIKVIEEKELKKLGMNLMMAVGGGAAKKDQPRLIIMEYKGADNQKAPWKAVVGKGVMFDTGGYNIKTGPYMTGMKCDMGGAAVVMGTMRALAARKAKVNVVGVCGCVMNMVSKDAFLPDSIQNSYKGYTVEIGNTDAEGRLVLADAIAYTIDKYKPVQVIDLATLTGAIMVALGGGYAGLFSNNDKMSKALKKSGDLTGERLWPMPIDDFYVAKSTVADINNDGNPYGGSSTAATFIKKFVGDTDWTHLDIAGTTLVEKRQINGILPVKGATGFGVRLLVDYYETNFKSDEEKVKKRRRKSGRGPGRPRKAS